MRRLFWIPFLALLAAPAQAQQQRVIVVPADAQVVIAARGQAQPRTAMAAAPNAAALARSRAYRPAGFGMDDILGVPAPALLPLLAAGIVAATMAARGGQGASAAPVRTR